MNTFLLFFFLCIHGRCNKYGKLQSSQEKVKKIIMWQGKDSTEKFNNPLPFHQTVRAEKISKK